MRRDDVFSNVDDAIYILYTELKHPTKTHNYFIVNYFIICTSTNIITSPNMAVVWGRYYMYACDIPIKKCHFVDDTVYYQQKNKL